MEDLNDKVTAGTLTATEYNQVPSELQNTITTSGQSLSGSDLTQLVKAVAHYMASSTFYTDSGVSNAYALTSIDANKNPPAYVDGMEIEFVIGNTNTGASTIIVDALTVVNITNTGTGGTLTTGDTVRLRYNVGSGEFVILGKSSTVSNLKVADYLASSASDILDRPWFLTNGDEISRTTFAELFSKIGESFGVGDGSSTFLLPVVAPLVPAITTNTGSFADQSLSPPNDIRGIGVDSFNSDVWIIEGTTDEVMKSDGGTGAFASVGSFPDAIPGGITVNSITGDVWAVGTNGKTIYRSRGGVGDFTQIGDYSADVTAGTGTPSPLTIAVDSASGDVWITDIGLSPPRIFVLKGGEGTYVETGDFPTVTIRDITVDSSNGDVWVIALTTVYKSAGGVATFVATGTYPGTQGVSITVDSENQNVWVIDDAQVLYLLTGGTGTFASVGSYPGGDTAPKGITVNPATGELWLADDTSDIVYKADGSVDVAAVEWYINHGIITPVPVVLASVISRQLGTSVSFDVNFSGAGANRGILAVIGIKDSAENFPTGVTIDGVEGTELYTESFFSSTTESFAVYYWDDGQHPGTGTFNLTTTTDTPPGRISISILELNNVIQTAGQVISSIVTDTVVDIPTSTVLNTVIPNESGKLGVAFFAGAATGFSDMSFSESANLANENFADSTNGFLATWEDATIDSVSESYDVTYTKTGGNEVNATIYGVFVINGV